MSSETAAARPASTILLMRDAPSGQDIEIFMMVRHHQIEFASGALVFPGGSLEPGDQEIVGDAVICAGVDGLDDATLAFRVGAIRETFEESGILLARPRGSGDLISAARASEIAAANRTALCDGKLSFAKILADNDLVLALDLLIPYAHWITPVNMPKRFDTWFFVAAAPPEQIGAHDGHESTDSLWLTPSETLAGGESGRFTLPFPTTRNLIRLGKFDSVASALEHARNINVVSVMPVMTKTGDKRQLRIPAEAGYDGEVFDI